MSLSLPGRRFHLLLVLLAVVMLVPGCAFFNTFYFARRHYQDAEAERIQAEREFRPISSRARQSYQQSLESATKVLIDYPDSRWVEEALQLSQKILYRQGELSASIQKGSELLENFPESDTIPECRLFLARARLEMGDALVAATDASLAAEGLEGIEYYEARLVMGQAYGEASSFDTAQTILTQLIDSEDTPADLILQARLELQKLLAERGDFRAAADIVMDVLDESRLTLTVHQENLLRLIDLLFSAGDLDAAEDRMAELERIDETGFYEGVLKYFNGILVGLRGDVRIARNEMVIALVTGVTREWEVRIRLDLAERLEASNTPEHACPEYRAVSMGIGTPEQARLATKRAAAIIRLFALKTMINRVEEVVIFKDPRGLQEARPQPTAVSQADILDRMDIMDPDRAALEEQLSQREEMETIERELSPAQLYGDVPRGIYLFVLAEHLALEMSQPDSALAYIDLLEKLHPESDLIPRSLYAIKGWLPEDATWQVLKAEAASRLLSDYPESTWAYHERLDRGEEPEKPMEIRADEALMRAEQEVDMLAPPGEWHDAVLSYRAIAVDYPGTPAAQRAELGMARLLELGAGPIDSARAAYEQIIDRYPDTPEALFAAERLGSDTTYIAPDPAEARARTIAQEIGAWTIWFQTRQAARVTILQPREATSRRVVVQQQQAGETQRVQTRTSTEIPPQ
ncbi:tol-pal system YbgF family protein [Gemmatimonadota bacterium]